MITKDEYLYLHEFEQALIGVTNMEIFSNFHSIGATVICLGLSKVFL